MQLQGLMFMLFILLIIPVLAISTNHFLFFAIMAVILIISSIKNIYTRFFDIVSDDDEDEDEESDDDTEAEFEELLNINMKKFGTGVYVVKDLFLILFFTYCSFYLNSILLKINASLLILIQIYHIKSVLSVRSSKKKMTTVFDRNLALVSGVLSLVLIAFTACNLVFQMNF